MRKGFLISLIIIGLFATTYYFLLFPIKVLGGDNTIFKNGQLYLSSKLTYLLRQPKTGDAIRFKINQGGSWSEHIGLIFLVGDGLLSPEDEQDGATVYLVVKSKEPQKIYYITADKIIAHVYYPLPILTEEEKEIMFSQQADYIKSRKELQEEKTTAPSISSIDGGVFVDKDKDFNKDPDEENVYFRKITLIDEAGIEYFQSNYQIVKIRSTDSTGRFRYTDLPLNRRYTIILEDETGLYTIPLKESYADLNNVIPKVGNLQIPVHLK